jgi:hypothetical protein
MHPMTRVGAEPKPPWRLVPRAVRWQVDELTAAHVQRALRVWGGYAPSPTFRLFLVDGRSVFFKGVNPTSNEHMHRALAAEERVYRELTPWITPWAPAFLGSFREADWHVLLLEDVAGTRVPPWSPRRVHTAMRGYAAFHRHSLGQLLPEWLSRERHRAFARIWANLADESGGLEGMASLAGARATEALDWTRAALDALGSAAERLLDAPPPHALLHFDTRSDNLRLQPGGGIRLFDWPYACVGPPELDLAAFAQSITYEGGPDPDDCMAAYTRDLAVRTDVMDASIAAMAGYFANHAWRDEIPDLPRVRSIQRRQLQSSLTWAARHLHLPPPDWLAALSP